MVNSCIAVSCTNCAKPGSGTSFHAFPYKIFELLQKWIQAVKTKISVPNKYSLIWSDHFEPSCFVVRPGKLGTDCMTIQFQQFPLHFLHTTKKANENGVCFTIKVCEPSPSKVAKVVGSEHSYASSTDNAQSGVKQLKKTVKILKQKVQ